MADKFEYNYNAPTQEERKEIDSILKDYLPTDNKNSKLERLRKLDFKVKNIPVILGISLGVIGTLIFGLGLTCVLEWHKMLLGIIIAIIGTIVIITAYPVFKLSHRTLKTKHAEEIIKLSNELLNIENE